MIARLFWVVACLAIFVQSASADLPVASYIFPAGGRRGTVVEMKVGGLNLHSKASFEMLGPGVEADRVIQRRATVWFEGPLVPLPESQQAEDYPQDYAGTIKIAADAPIGPRAWRVWTSQGVAGSLPFEVGDLPEVVERERDDDASPQTVALPVTINGRIFPREDVDFWAFPLRAGELLSCSVAAGRLGSPLEPWLEALGEGGVRIADSTTSRANDGRLSFVAPKDGTYTVKIHDVNIKGGQNYVYRLTLTTGASVERVFPLGGRRGSATIFAPIGLGAPRSVETLTLTSNGAGEGPEAAVVTFASAGSATVEIDDLPEVVETEPNDDPSHASSLPVPGVGNGRVDRARDVDAWSVALGKGRRYSFDLRAARLGSKLDGVLALTDPAGKEVARAEGLADREGDPFFTFQAPADGIYRITVRDRFHSRGGSAWAYRLRASEAPAADFRLTFAADALSLPRGGATPLKIQVVRIGEFNGPIALEVEGLPEGVSVAKTVVSPGAGAIDLPFKAEATAPIRSARITIRGTAEIAGLAVKRVAFRPEARGLPRIDDVRVAVALATPFKIAGPLDFGWTPRGSVRRRHYRIERNGFDGPIEVRLADRQARHLQGVSGPVVTVPPGVVEFDYEVAFPPWMEIGRTSRAVVMATGSVREPDGLEHETSFSTLGNELQVVAVIGPGRLGLESARTSFAFDAGPVAEIPVKIARGKGVSGPVRVELVDSSAVLGFSAEPLILKDDQNAGVLRIVRDASGEIASTSTAPVRIVIRARAVTADGPLIAETGISFVGRP